MDDNPGTELSSESVDGFPQYCGFMHLDNRIEDLVLRKSPDTPCPDVPKSRDPVDRIHREMSFARRWLATLKSVIDELKESERNLRARFPLDPESEALLLSVKLSLENAVAEFTTEFPKRVESVREKREKGLEYPGPEHYSRELCTICERAIVKVENKISRLFDAAVRLESEVADADTASTTAPDAVGEAREIRERPTHQSETQTVNKEPAENTRAEWWISTDDGSLFFRTVTNENEDGVPEFKLDTKIQIVMALLCERGNEGVSIVQILEAAYPSDLEKLRAILREAPREDAGDASIESSGNLGVLNIAKKAKQACRTVRGKLESNGIPGEVLEVLPGLEDPAAPMAFLRVQGLRKKSVNGFKVYPKTVKASGLSEHSENASRPHL